jgi:hypothetical protein
MEKSTSIILSKYRDTYYFCSKGYSQKLHNCNHIIIDSERHYKNIYYYYYTYSQEIIFFITTATYLNIIKITLYSFYSNLVPLYKISTLIL